MNGLLFPAPAKINLYLHVLGRRADGYHRLDSLVGFTELGDEIRIEPAEELSLQIDGPFAADVPVGEDNLIIKAARMVADKVGKPPACRITLTKNLPAGSGIGGGSADAAATARGMLQFFQSDTDIRDNLITLGADIPACFQSEPLRFLEIGEEIEPVSPFPTLPILLINPGQICPTQAVFKSLKLPEDRTKTALPIFDTPGSMFDFLDDTDNDLMNAAIECVPAIAEVLDALRESEARIVRLSGSGATGFGLFETDEACALAANDIASAHPNWWVQPTRIKAST